TEVEPDPRDLLRGLGRTDASQETLGRVESSVGVVVAEGIAVRPVVAVLAKLARVRLLDPVELTVEWIPAGAHLVRDVLGEHPKLHVRVERGVLTRPAVAGVLGCDERGPAAPVRQVRPENPGDEGIERGCHRIEHLADAVAIAGSHDQSISSRVSATSVSAKWEESSSASPWSRSRGTFLPIARSTKRHSRSRRSWKNWSKSSWRRAVAGTRWASSSRSRCSDVIWARRSMVVRYDDGAAPPMVRLVTAETAVLLTMLSRCSSSMPCLSHQALGKMWWMSTARLAYWTLSRALSSIQSRAPLPSRSA